MKKIIQFIIAIVVSMFFSSCVSNITIYGKPGTEIFTPMYKKIATINNNGKVKIQKDILSYNYNTYLFLISKDVGSSIYIPFAMDYSRGSFLNVNNKQQTNSDIQFVSPVFLEPDKTMKDAELHSQLISENEEKKQSINNIVSIPFKSGTYNVLQVVSHFNEECIKTESKGTVTVENNMICINIPDISRLQEKKITITKNLNKKKIYGNPERVYNLYSTDDGQELGIYFDDSLAQIGVLEQKILFVVNESISFEIAWM